MATVTPNFNWPVPTSTDLVKDGATAIEALGDSIDASLVDLKGGTTGQVLSKTSGTDMDFTWVTSDDANAIQNTIVDAKGDLIAATAADTPARLAVGSNGETLVADSSTSTGLRYQGTNAAGKNAVINGDCLIAQRGTAAITLSSASGTHYPVDRFFAVGHSGSTAQQITSISNTSFKNAVRVQRTAGNTTTSDLSFTQTFETNTSIPFQGKSVTLSFWARAGANFSPTSGTLTSRVYTGTGTDQNGFGFTWTGTANPVNQGNTLTTSWQRFTATGTISSSATQIQVFFFCSPTGTAGAADYFDITGVQLEAGSVATAFQTATGTIQGELAACQRYYFRVVSGNLYTPLTAGGFSQSTTSSLHFTPFPTEMRVAPTGVEQSGTASQYGINESGGGFTCSAVPSFNTATKVGAATTFTFASGLTVGRGAWGRSDNNTTAFLAWSAEL